MASPETAAPGVSGSADTGSKHRAVDFLRQADRRGMGWSPRIRHTVSVTVAELKNALEEYGHWITCRPKIGYRLESPLSDELIKTGWHFWNRRSREGFDKALECFQQAARENDSDARAYEGIAISWLMPGTYGMRAPREIYPGYLSAYNRAVALGGLTHRPSRHAWSRPAYVRAQTAGSGSGVTTVAARETEIGEYLYTARDRLCDDEPP